MLGICRNRSSGRSGFLCMALLRVSCKGRPQRERYSDSLLLKAFICTIFLLVKCSRMPRETLLPCQNVLQRMEARAEVAVLDDSEYATARRLLCKTSNNCFLLQSSIMSNHPSFHSCEANLLGATQGCLLSQLLFPSSSPMRLSRFEPSADNGGGAVIK